MYLSKAILSSSRTSSQCLLSSAVDFGAHPIRRSITSFTMFNIPFVFCVAGLMEVIIYSSPDDKKKNRGFCFLEYESHKAASLAKRRLGTGRIKVWGCDIIVDWADPQEEPDEQTMSKVKVLYVRNLTQEISEEKLKESFEQYGKVERVKKIKDYAFIHFEDRENAVKVSVGAFFYADVLTYLSHFIRQWKS